MRFAALLLAFALVPGSLSAPATAATARKPTTVQVANKPPVTEAATLRLTFDGNGICSGTAVARNTILTASHCFDEPFLRLSVNGIPVNMKKVLHDGADHALIVTDMAFPRVATLGKNLPSVGDEVHFWGNPGPLSNMYRRGYTSGRREDGAIVFDVNTYFGDSGAGVFNRKTGKLVAVVSFVTGDLNKGFRLMGAWPLKFSNEQLGEAGL